MFFIFTSHIKSAAVCDLELLILELKQDLDDNGILDCLRVINPPNGVIETAEQKNKRLSAQWDSSCARNPFIFELRDSAEALVERLLK